jgi:membrane-bound metal-dependent hydrolase YbcI (DUF457 family)
MPVTPFHFGIGLLGKGILPGRVSLSAFVLSQIVIDCETVYFLLIVQEWPVHRWAHTLIIGTCVGLAVGLAWGAAGRLWTLNADRRRSFAPELAMGPSAIGGTLGGATHPILDAIMHGDVQPFRPFLEGNPFLGLLSVTYLHVFCIATAVVGGWLLISRRARRALEPAGDAKRSPQ